MALLKGKTALVLGASGVVGSGAVHQFLEHGAKVAVVSRTQQKLDELLAQFPEKKDRIFGVVGTFQTKATVQEWYAKVKQLLGGAPDHVVSTIGFAVITPKGITESEISSLIGGFEESLYPTIFSSQVILPDLKDKDATYTIVNGGLGHKCYFPGAWATTVKSAAIEGVIKSLAADTESSKVRVYGNCIHFSVAPPGVPTNQLGRPTDLDSVSFGKTFIRFIQKPELKGQIVCFHGPKDAEVF